MSIISTIWYVDKIGWISFIFRWYSIHDSFSKQLKFYYHRTENKIGLNGERLNINAYGAKGFVFFQMCLLLLYVYTHTHQHTSIHYTDILWRIFTFSSFNMASYHPALSHNFSPVFLRWTFFKKNNATVTKLNAILLYTKLCICSCLYMYLCMA